MKNRKSETKIKIKKTLLSNLDRVSEIEKASFSVDAYSKKRLHFLCKHKDNCFMLAVLNDLPVAYILACPEKLKMNIISIAVDPKYQKLGIGTKLINFIIRKSKRMKFKEVSLEVSTINKGAINFYNKIGFKTVNIIKKYYKNGKSAQKMILEIK
jgi:ribosomal-protein-alanine N-acetyltransferase